MIDIKLTDVNYMTDPKQIDWKAANMAADKLIEQFGGGVLEINSIDDKYTFRFNVDGHPSGGRRFSLISRTDVAVDRALNIGIINPKAISNLTDEQCKNMLKALKDEEEKHK